MDTTAASGPSAPTPSTPPPSSSEPQLIFDQQGWRPSSWRLVWFLFISLLGHVGVFYLFKVITPTTTKRLPPENKVLLLRGVDPESAHILSSLEDRSPASMLVSLTPSEQQNLPQLALPAYTPSYKDYVMNYRFNWVPTLGALPQLAAPDQPLLPKRATRRVAPRAPAAVSAGPKLTFPPELNARGLTAPPAWAATLAAPEEPAEPQVFRLAIEPSGIVKYCLSEGTSPAPSVLETLRHLQFNAQLDQPLQWVEVTVHW